MQIRIESQLNTKIWTHQDRIKIGLFSLIVSNANGMEIFKVILVCIDLYVFILIALYIFFCYLDTSLFI